ncbi:MAG TPA: zinc-binding dehydrogenase [Steroidobacteraceae bacterium]|nr:zinc-binding dehydrogenase [Steroidobacteraceae bacterium]
MQHNEARTGLQLRSLVKESGELEVSLTRVPTPTPAADEVLIRIEAAPINPSDLGLLFAGADISQASRNSAEGHPVVVARVPDAALKSMATRIGVSMPVGNEGAGVVVEAGASDAAQALLGKTVAALGGAMYSQYRCVPVEQCLVLPDGATPADGASAFVNPLTALCMIETMRGEGHTALVHTAAASNLGKMLNRICDKERIALVNIVRSQSQADLLRAMGAAHVCDSNSSTFVPDLIEALSATGATLAFDAIGGGKLASQILMCMEAALLRKAKQYSRYGSPVHKQVYVYGGLGMGPIELNRNFGMAWGVGGWLVTPFLQKLGPAATQRLKQRVASELRSTFASSYAGEVSLAEALDLKTIAVYGKSATGQKYLINPNKGV